MKKYLAFIFASMIIAGCTKTEDPAPEVMEGMEAYWYGGAILLLVIADLFFRVMDRFYWGKMEKSEFESRLSTLESTIEAYKVTDVKNYNEGLKAWQEVYDRAVDDHKKLTEKFDKTVAEYKKTIQELETQLTETTDKLEEEVAIATGGLPEPATPLANTFIQLKGIQGLMANTIEMSGLKEVRQSMTLASNVMKELNRKTSLLMGMSADTNESTEDSEIIGAVGISSKDPKTNLSFPVDGSDNAEE